MKQLCFVVKLLQLEIESSSNHANAHKCKSDNERTFAYHCDSIISYSTNAQILKAKVKKEVNKWKNIAAISNFHLTHWHADQYHLFFHTCDDSLSCVICILVPDNFCSECLLSISLCLWSVNEFTCLFHLYSSIFLYSWNVSQNTLNSSLSASNFCRQRH